MRGLFFVLLLIPVIFLSCAPDKRFLDDLTSGAEVYFVENENGSWGIRLTRDDTIDFYQTAPVQLEFFNDDSIQYLSDSYSTLSIEGGIATGLATIQWKGCNFDIKDEWSVHDDELLINRSIVLSGSQEGGFMSSITFNGMKDFTRQKADLFVPGMLYGSPANLNKRAIGGVETREHIRIREDRLPAPVFAAMFANGSTVAVFDPQPKANTTQEDSEDYKARTLIDNRFTFGSLGVNWAEDSTFQIGFWYPGSEGEITYAGNTYPGGQLKKWRLRYHEMTDGFEQNYKVIFRFTRDESNFPDYYSQTWRWAWKKLNPKIHRHDIEEIKLILLNMLGERAITKNGRTGFPQSIRGAAYEPYSFEDKATLGFVGKNLEASYFLLRDAQEREGTPVGQKHRVLATGVIESFIKMPVAPPAAEGFDLDDGSPRYFGHGKNFSTVYLRSYGDDMKSLLKAIKFERAHGREHNDWLAWARKFGDWLLTQQKENGGFPRAWDGKTGEVLDPSAKTSYNPIPMFLLLAELTGEEQYREAAIKAGEFAWHDGQNKGLFVGATIDNPDVVDKEAGTLSTEAYLALYEATKEEKWIKRASAAADFAETWIYLWEIPPPVDNKDHTIGLKEGMTTIGNQLISTGHSLTDNYMAFDVDEYVKLYRLTNDSHYLDVARILLHNTKSWIPTPAHPYDMKGYGWQQEHWSLAPHRGHGMHRRWLPWVTTSHLNGIYGLQDINVNINLE